MEGKILVSLALPTPECSVTGHTCDAKFCAVLKLSSRDILGWMAIRRHTSCLRRATKRPRITIIIDCGIQLCHLPILAGHGQVRSVLT